MKGPRYGSIKQQDTEKKYLPCEKTAVIYFSGAVNGWGLLNLKQDHFIRALKKAGLFFNDMSIRTKLLLYFMAFSVFLVLSVGIISFSKSSNVINQQTVVYSDIVLKQVIGRIEGLMDEIMKISIPIVSDPKIQNNDLDSIDAVDFMNRKQQIESDLTSKMSIKKDICSIYICTESGYIFSPNAVSEKDLDNYKNYTVYKSAMKERLKPTWTGLHENEFEMDNTRHVVTFSRALFTQDNFKSFGALIINIPDDTFNKICKVDLDNKSYRIFIVNKKGETIYNSLGDTGMEHIDRGYISRITGSDSSTGEFNWIIGSLSYKVMYIASEKQDWIYIAEIPQDYLLQNSMQVRNYLVLILLIGIIMSFGAAYAISTVYTVPFRKMAKTMRRVEKGDFDIQLDIRNRNEIGQLAASYTSMVNEIKGLIQRVNNEHTQKREAELNALQAQISPHFLYNTLNSIKSLARVQKADGIVDMTSSLIELLQLSISNKVLYISVGEEIEMVRKYVFLQNFRYGNKFKVVFECEEEVLKYRTLKMILQPLVENSIYHGIEYNNEQGIICIRAYKSDSGIHLEVEDNGVGMNDEMIARILNDDRKSNSRFGGIGVRNINDRIKMHFGENYGLTYRSEPGKYTVASIFLPAVQADEVIKYV